jgi:hypothetical protein
MGMGLMSGDFHGHSVMITLKNRPSHLILLFMEYVGAFPSSPLDTT